jgi:hypothetical protein
MRPRWRFASERTSVELQQLSLTLSKAMPDCSFNPTFMNGTQPNETGRKSTPPHTTNREKKKNTCDQSNTNAIR